MKYRLIAISFVSFLSIGGAVWLTTQNAAAQAPAQPNLQGFSIDEIRFDESMGDKKPTPVIPKDWRFITVSSGEKANSNNLWFQDSVGNIYMLQGFTSYRKFIVDGKIQKLAAK